jgi:N-acetylmuramoyl-L-alanine amidase
VSLVDVVLFCLALNVYFEARGEPLAGQYAVAEVTLLRAELSGRGVCEEVFADRQFSWTLHRRPKVRNAQAWENSKAVALGAISTRTSFSNGATNFYNPRLAKPKWALTMCETAHIGRHRFMRPCR